MTRRNLRIKPNPKRKRGRPTVIELKGDPELGRKALVLRRSGLSWTQISDRLEISRTSARRLCQKSGNTQRDSLRGRMKE